MKIFDYYKRDFKHSKLHLYLGPYIGRIENCPVSGKWSELFIIITIKVRLIVIIIALILLNTTAKLLV